MSMLCASTLWLGKGSALEPELGTAFCKNQQVRAGYTTRPTSPCNPVAAWCRRADHASYITVALKKCTCLLATLYTCAPAGRCSRWSPAAPAGARRRPGPRRSAAPCGPRRPAPALAALAARAARARCARWTRARPSPGTPPRSRGIRPARTASFGPVWLYMRAGKALGSGRAHPRRAATGTATPRAGCCLGARGRAPRPAPRCAPPPRARAARRQRARCSARALLPHTQGAATQSHEAAK